jgi:hypothetical protein
MKVIIFVPGYVTSQTCSFAGDTYLDIYKYALKTGYEFVYLPIPNNNYGDVGNTTLDDCVADVLSMYNKICVERNFQKEDTITLAGHSMGGLIVSKLVTGEYITKLKRLPELVRMINPALGPICSRSTAALGTLLSFLPESVLGFPTVPIPIAGRDGLYPGSRQVSTPVKPLLAMSLLRTTGKLLVNNTTWVLKPDINIRERLTIVQCVGDKLVSYEDARDHANQYQITLIAIPDGYHEWFDDVVLAATFV